MTTMLQRKPTLLPAWHLTDQVAMMTALGELSPYGWRGAISCDQAGGWKLELSVETPTPRTITATTGQWLVLDGDLRVMSSTECDAAYDEAPGGS